jgi:hypothetical protein
MMGSPVAASLVAHLAFWTLVGWGTATGALTWRGAAMFASAWLLLPLALRYTSYGPLLYSPLVAALDVLLVLLIFKGDVRLT